MPYIFVDCEGYGPAAALNNHLKFEFGAVEYKTRETFHGGPGVTPQVFDDFRAWLKTFKGRPIFISDNPAYDWQFINYYFHMFDRQPCGTQWEAKCACNPFGHSARRISDFYAGLKGDFSDTQAWKRLRITSHDHNPVNDAMGNVEAFARLMEGER